jgi:hypothetical protein
MLGRTEQITNSCVSLDFSTVLQRLEEALIE